MEVGLSPGDIVLDGEPAPSEKKGTAPTQFLAHVYCGQTARWLKMPLGTKVDLSPGHIALDGEWTQLPPPCERGTASPSFRTMSIVATVANLSYCWALVKFWGLIISLELVKWSISNLVCRLITASTSLRMVYYSQSRVHSGNVAPLNFHKLMTISQKWYKTETQLQLNTNKNMSPIKHHQH